MKFSVWAHCISVTGTLPRLGVLFYKLLSWIGNPEQLQDESMNESINLILVHFPA